MQIPDITTEELLTSRLPTEVTTAGYKVELTWELVGRYVNEAHPVLHHFSAVIPMEVAVGLNDFADLQRPRGLAFQKAVELLAIYIGESAPSYRIGWNLVAMAEGPLELTFRLTTGQFATPAEALLAAPEAALAKVRDAGYPASSWREAKKRARALRQDWPRLGEGYVTVPAFDRRLQVWDYHYQGPKVIQVARCEPESNLYLDSLAKW